MRHLLILIACLWAAVAVGQPVLDSTYGPTERTSFTKYFWGAYSNSGNPDPFSPIPIGNNVQYQYTITQGDFNGDYHFSKISQRQAGPALGSTILAYNPWHRFPGDSLFFINKADGFYLKANCSTVGNAEITPGELMVPYNLAFGEQRVDSLLVTYTGSFPSFDRIIDTSVYAGAGSLELNGTFFPEVALIRMVSRGCDSNWQPYAASPEIIYSWFVPEMGMPVLSLTFRSTSSGPYVTSSYLTNLVTRTRTISQLISSFPNPAHNRLHVTATGPVQVISAAGKAFTLALSQDGWLDVSALAPGLYTLEAGGRRSRFVKE